MIPKSLPEHLVKDNTILPQASLTFFRDLEAKTGCHDPASCPTFLFLVFPEELQSACRYSGSLFPQSLCCFPAHRKAHAIHPIPHAAAECDFPASCTDRLGLQVKQDHAGASTVRHAVGYGLSLGLHSAGLYPEGDLMSLFFPGLIVRKSLVGQAG